MKGKGEGMIKYMRATHCCTRVAQAISQVMNKLDRSAQKYLSHQIINCAGKWLSATVPQHVHTKPSSECRKTPPAN